MRGAVFFHCVFFFRRGSLKKSHHGIAGAKIRPIEMIPHIVAIELGNRHTQNLCVEFNLPFHIIDANTDMVNALRGDHETLRTDRFRLKPTRYPFRLPPDDSTRQPHSPNCFSVATTVLKCLRRYRQIVKRAITWTRSKHEFNGCFIITLTCHSMLLAAEAKRPPEWDKAVEEAKKEGKIVLAIPPATELRTALEPLLRQKFGLEAELMSAPGPKNASRIAAEKKAGVSYFDAIICGTGTAAGLTHDGMLEPMESFWILP